MIKVSFIDDFYHLFMIYTVYNFYNQNTMNKINIFFGLDLSLNSTGVTAAIQHNDTIENICFHRLIYDDETNVKKKYAPVAIENLNQKTYTIPKNIALRDYVCDDEEMSTKEQIFKTFQALQCSQEIQKILTKIVDFYAENNEICNLVFCIENYIMPKFSGKANLNDVGSLIALQAYIREFVIKFSLVKNIPTKILTPAPKKLKSFFTGNGEAEKNEMLQIFIDLYDGKKLLPSIKENKAGSINDVIDSFALMVYAFTKINFGS